MIVLGCIRKCYRNGILVDIPGTIDLDFLLFEKQYFCLSLITDNGLQTIKYAIDSGSMHGSGESQTPCLHRRYHQSWGHGYVCSKRIVVLEEQYQAIGRQWSMSDHWFPARIRSLFWHQITDIWGEV